MRVSYTFDGSKDLQTPIYHSECPQVFRLFTVKKLIRLTSFSCITFGSRLSSNLCEGPMRTCSAHGTFVGPLLVSGGTGRGTMVLGVTSRTGLS